MAREKLKIEALKAWLIQTKDPNSKKIQRIPAHEASDLVEKFNKKHKK